MTRLQGQSSENTRSVILDLIRSSHTISRTELAEKTGLTGATITRIVKSLIDDSLVIETGFGDSTGGKRPTLLQLNVESGYSIGLSIDDARLTYVVTDLGGTVVGGMVSEGAAEWLWPIVDRIGRELDGLLDRLSIDARDVVGLGVASAGSLDAEHNTLRLSRTIDPRESFAVKESLEKRTSLRVTLENDSTCAALAEFWIGRIPATRSFATIFMATGIGCGLMVEGRILRGASANAGTIAHTVINSDGPECWCGARGCLEMLASPACVVRRATESAALVESLSLGGTPMTVREDFSRIGQAASRGDSRCVEIIEESAAFLAIAVVSTINLLDLDQVFLSGPGFADAGAIYLRVLRERVERVAFMRTVLPIKVDLSEISMESAAIGGAALVLQEHLTPHHFSPAVVF